LILYDQYVEDYFTLEKAVNSLSLSFDMKNETKFIQNSHIQSYRIQDKTSQTTSKKIFFTLDVKDNSRSFLFDDENSQECIEKNSFLKKNLLKLMIIPYYLKFTINFS
jgi:hypothetical protein